MKTRGVLVAVIIASAVVAAVITLTALLFTGVIRFGTPSLTNVVVAGKINSNTMRPRDIKNSFPKDQPSIYCCAHANAFGDTILESRWYFAGSIIGRYARSFSGLTGTSPGKFHTTGGNVAFYLNMPADGWISGEYTVELLIGGNKTGTAAFNVTEGKSKSEMEEMVQYQDPSKSFSISYPAGWEEADQSTLDGALAGFIKPSGGKYPPRFVVVLTDFTLVSPDYLNGVVKVASPGAPEAFTQYSINDKVGARRTFQWEYKSGASVVRLKSIQVVIQGSKHVYGLYCHSEAARFDANLPVFNSVINSFRVFQ